MSDKRKIITDTYGSNGAPDAAKFGKGHFYAGRRETSHRGSRKAAERQNNANGGPVRQE
jgi:hypothetical protein